MRTTVDYLKGEEKAKYKQSGRIVKWNMYKQLIPIGELETYTKDNQKSIIEAWRDVHTEKEILHYLGITAYKYNKLLHSLGIVKNQVDENQETEQIKAVGISRKQLMEFPQQERYYKLAELFNVYTAEQIGKAWGVKKESLYSMRYKLKKYMNKNNLPLEREYESETAITPKSDNLLEYANKIEQEQEQKEQSSAGFEVIEDDLDELMKDHKPILINDDEHQKYIEAANMLSNKTKLAPTEADNILKEWKELKKTVQDQYEFVQALMKQQNVNAAVTTETIEKPAESNKSGMIFSFDAEKEGFLLFEDLKRFIKVLEKNPDNFHVEVSVTRKEQE